MRNTISKLALTASIVLAMAFTFSCSGDDGTDEPSSSSAENPSSSVTEPSSSSIPGSSVTTPSSSSVTASSSSSQPSSSSQAIVPIYGDPITDTRDGKTYKTVIIGKQTWMAENLNFETTEGSKCYNDNVLNCSLYGRLYNWDAAMNACPAGWHLPNDMEWAVLEGFVGNSMTVEAAWKKLRSTSFNSGVNNYGTDDYGFSATFINSIGGGYWSSAENGTNGYYRSFEGNFYSTAKSSGTLPVRCLKGDNSPTPPSSSSFDSGLCVGFAEGTTREHHGKSKPQFCDVRDGKKYVYVEIDSKTWMAENLNFAAEGSVCYEEDPANCEKSGRLYDWSTAMAFFEPACNKADCSSWITENHKGICPTGWHVPSREEFVALGTFAGGSSTAGQVLKAESGWIYEGNPGNGADLLGFSALPGGSGTYLGDYAGSYLWILSGSLLSLWSSTIYERTDAYDLSITSNNNGASISGLLNSKSSFYSLRCVRD